MGVVPSGNCNATGVERASPRRRTIPAKKTVPMLGFEVVNEINEVLGREGGREGGLYRGGIGIILVFCGYSQQSILHLI